MSTTRKTHKLAVTAMLAAVASVLMALDFPIPFLIPPFVKMDFSELPALLATFSLGPASGAACALSRTSSTSPCPPPRGRGSCATFCWGCASWPRRG